MKISEKLGQLSQFYEKDNKGNEPLLLEIELILEDKEQPRQKFDETSLKELANSIKERGVKTPISVRKVNDTYIINHGARRYRASKLAGLKKIPVYIDEDYTLIDQIVENVQRENLTPIEIALACEKLIKEFNKSQNEIAVLMGKSNSYITQHLKLLKLSTPIKNWFDNEFVTDVTVINELENLFKKHGEKVIEFFEPEFGINRTNIKEFKEFIKATDEERIKNDNVIDSFFNNSNQNENEVEIKNSVENKPVKNLGKEKIKKPYVTVTYYDKNYRLDLKQKASSNTRGWIINETNNEELEVDLTDLKIIFLFDDIKTKL